MSSGHQHIKSRRNIDENFNRLSRVHECYRQTDDRQTDDSQTFAKNQDIGIPMRIVSGCGTCGLKIGTSY